MACVLPRLSRARTYKLRSRRLRIAFADQGSAAEGLWDAKGQPRRRRGQSPEQPVHRTPLEDYSWITNGTMTAPILYSQFAPLNVNNCLITTSLFPDLCYIFAT